MLDKLRARLAEDPNAIWFVAGPLILTTVTLCLLRAILEWRINHDPNFLIVFTIFGTLGGVAIFKLWKTYRRFNP